MRALGTSVDESDTDGVECCRTLRSRREVASAIYSLLNVRNLQLECARVFYFMGVIRNDLESCVGRREGWKKKLVKYSSVV